MVFLKTGDKIRYHRIQKGITQEQLADGIISKSYLSKIENNTAKPHRDVVNLLFKRLEIPSLEEDTQRIKEINRKLDEWYEVVKSRDKDNAIKMEKSISDDISRIENTTVFIRFRLFSLRHHLLLYNFDESKKIIQEFKALEKHLPDQQKYYFYYFYGLYQYLHNNFSESLDYYSKAEKIGYQLHIDEPELTYLISLVHTRLNHVTLAIHYANTVLDLSNQNMDYLRSIETQSILAINYMRIKEYDKAKHHLEKSLKITEKHNDPYLISNIYHNLGYLYSKVDQHDLAIDYYHKSLNLKKGCHERITNTIYYLAESYYAVKNIEDATRWIKKGLKITEKYNIINNQIKLYLLQLEQNIDQEQSRKYIEETAIRYLQEKQNWKELSEAAEKLSNYYANQQSYKKAQDYCCLANDARKHIQM